MRRCVWFETHWKRYPSLTQNRETETSDINLLRDHETCGLDKFIGKQAEHATPGQPISTAVTVVREFEAFGEQ